MHSTEGATGVCAPGFVEKFPTCVVTSFVDISVISPISVLLTRSTSSCITDLIVASRELGVLQCRLTSCQVNFPQPPNSIVIDGGIPTVRYNSSQSLRPRPPPSCREGFGIVCFLTPRRPFSLTTHPINDDRHYECRQACSPDSSAMAEAKAHATRRLRNSGLETTSQARYAACGCQESLCGHEWRVCWYFLIPTLRLWRNQRSQYCTSPRTASGSSSR